MDLVQIIYALGALASGGAAVLAWRAKLAWSAEFREAKDAQLKAKDELALAKDATIASLKTQIQMLEQFASPQLQQYIDGLKARLEGFNSLLQEQLAETQLRLLEREERINALEKDGQANSTEVQSLRIEKSQLAASVAQLENKLESIELKQREASTLQLHTKKPWSPYVVDLGNLKLESVDWALEDADKLLLSIRTLQDDPSWPGISESHVKYPAKPETIRLTGSTPQSSNRADLGGTE